MNGRPRVFALKRRHNIPLKAASAADGMLPGTPQTVASPSRAFAVVSKIGQDFSPDIKTQPQNGLQPLGQAFFSRGMAAQRKTHISLGLNNKGNALISNEMQKTLDDNPD